MRQGDCTLGSISLGPGLKEVAKIKKKKNSITNEGHSKILINRFGHSFIH